MFSILDRLYALKENLFGREKVFSSKPDISDCSQASESWYCFVSGELMDLGWISNGILPKKGKITTYPISATNIISPDVEETLRKLRAIYKDANSRIRKDVRDGLTINLLGISLGNVLSIRAATKIPEDKLKTLVSLVGGGNLGLSAWNSFITGKIVRQAASTAEEYENKVSEFSPINYMGMIHPQKIFGRFGRFDLLIPYKQGKVLKKGLESIKGDKNIKVYPIADHCSTMLFASRSRNYRQYISAV